MITKTLNKIFGTKHERDMKRLQPLIDAINSLEPKFKAMTDDDLKAVFAYLRSIPAVKNQVSLPVIPAAPGAKP